MRVVDRYELARDLRKRYAAASRAERRTILDAFCVATGYNRKYAGAVLRDTQARVAVRRRAPRRRVYGIRFREALTVAWEASRLRVLGAAPALPRGAHPVARAARRSDR